MAQNFVQSKVKPSKVTMFEKSSCPFCVRAKGILTKYKFKEGHLEIIDISKLDFMSSLQQYFMQTTGESTPFTCGNTFRIGLKMTHKLLSMESDLQTKVPRIYIGEKCIGGCSDLVPLENSGELEKALESMGALHV
ncbi:hypothetical protein XELAEV_18008060mg [Xenopus laevis]|uniref:Glutaredoxin-1 n=1 Tax=Xenopus laevis TaxID=8355 RepID=A0A974E3Z5_XENLA|nr:hypothetical protein XELAEV_18008060mg [Xenopus laevis]